MIINNNKPILLRTKNQIYEKIMIKSLSPYYFLTTWISPLTGATATSYTINLYIWDGLKTAIPTTPQYSLTKQNVSNSVGTDSINVARLVNDFIEFIPTIVTGLTATNNQRWVHKEIIYTTANPTDDGVKQSPETELLLKGYTYGNEGVNAQPPTNFIYLNGSEFKANRNTIFSLPLRMGAGVIFVQSFPNNEIYEFIDTSGANILESSEVVKMYNLDLSQTTTDKYVIVNYNGVDIYIGIEDEHKYQPYNIYFINKEGEQQTLTFFKERTEGMTVTKSTYENDSGQPKDGIHQYVDLNVQARTKFSLSSGFINESLNQGFKELSLSTRVYIYEGGILIPVNVSTKDVEYKTRVNNKLVNYVFNFKYSYNEINNI